MNKEICKAIMVTLRLRNKFLTKKKTRLSREAYKKQRNYCVKLIRERKIKYFGNLDVKNLTEKGNRKKETAGPNFSSKKTINENILSWGKID